MRIKKARIERFGRATLAMAIVSCLPAWQVRAQSAPTADTRFTFDVPAGSLTAALARFSAQTGIQTSNQPDQLAGKQVGALSGTMTWREALGRLLHGSGLEYEQINATTVIVRPAGPRPKSSATPAAASPSSKASAGAKPAVTDMQSVTVTGTRIRGGTTPSPVITIGAENIQEEGFSDLGQVIRSVPQNFTGGQNPGVLMGNVTGSGLSNQNLTGGSGLNLRGLGPDASLTLLDGHRMSYSGFVQAVDISAIPVEAVERVEIVADGASAIYGSDAVGGVANVLLDRDFDGVTLGARYGAATEGGLATREYNATAGTAWSSGGFIATYKYASNDPIYARQRDYTDQLPVPSTIYPGAGLHSALISAHQSIGDFIELRLDALRTERTQSYSYYAYSPTVYNHLSVDTTTTLVSPTIEFSLPNDWSLSLGNTWGKDERNRLQTSVSALDSTSTPYADNCDCDRIRTWEAGAEGPLFALPGGDARLAVGVGYRKNQYVSTDYLADAVDIDGDESVRYGYAELNLPLIGGTSIEGSPRLAMTAALRRERYDSFSGTTTPKVGLIYNLNADFTVKASWGRSFKAPTLFQLYNPSTAIAIAPSVFGGTGYAPDDTLLFLNGGNRDLKPERARTWTASLAFHPEALPGLAAELTWFDIDYQDRVIQAVTNSDGALSNPNYQEFIDYSPTAEKVAETVAKADEFYNFTGLPYDPSRVVAILNARYVNATRQKLSGADVSSSYGVDLKDSHLTIRGSASWLESTQKTAGTPYAYDLAGTLNNPAKVNGRLGAVWRRGGFFASVFANYIGGVTDTIHHADGSSMTTFDGSLGYNTGDRAGAWSNVDVSLSVQNLLDRHPPLYTPTDPAFLPSYDSTNYSAIGRFVSISVSKHW